MNPPANPAVPRRRPRVAGLRQAAKRGPRKSAAPGPGEQPGRPIQDEPTSAQQPADPRAGGGPRRRLAGAFVVLLTAAVVLAGGLVGFLAYDLLQQRAAEEAREKALAAAEMHTPVLLSYDYRHLDQDLAKAQAVLTGDFKEKYAETFTKVVKPTATQYRAVVVGNVAAAGVIRAEPDEAQVLMFVNQQATNSQLKAPRLDLSRVRMTLKKTGAGWLVSNIEAL
ncbi:hypothetical protein C3Y87_03765 [Carbonactinospora thermoautotrophica]|uniref:hypothetical protein n=1 Tax=Carbonactinospora thermoautotrophica TaxID=1469144 RepID=UPI002270C8F1|nr:hypothetical protein [Carbonactinospora thermoautotrophica]MCX9190545.1 hypothetical protein [Carbonactinospora thermoautotrophica]